MEFSFFTEFWKPCLIRGLVRNFSSHLLSFLIGAWVSKKLSIFDRYSFIGKLTSFSSMFKICSLFIWLKSEINLQLSIFFQSRLRILDHVTGNFEKKSGKKKIIDNDTRMSMWHQLIQFPLKKLSLKKYYQLR